MRFVAVAALVLVLTGCMSVEEPSPEPTPTPSPTPAPSSYTLTPSGGNDTAAIQGAVDACGTKGGTVSFAPGTYTITSSIKLPPNNAALLTLSGYGAKIVLDGAASFLEFNDSRRIPQQWFKYFMIQGFELDATARANVSGAYFIGAYNDISGIFVKLGDVEHIDLHDLYIHGAPSCNPTGGNAVAIGLGCKQTITWEPITNYVRDIEIDNVRIEGGDTGILVMTDLRPSQLPASLPGSVNQVCDDIHIGNVDFRSGKVPPFGSVKYHTGIQINGWGKGGTVEIHDCYLQGSEDNLCEIDNMQVATLTNVYTKEVYGGCAFQIRGFGYTLDADPPTEGTMLVTYNNCTYDQGTRGAEGDTGFGYAWKEINHRDHPTYTVVYNDCREIAPDGTVTHYTGP